jgi:hypothetical protein
MYGRLTFVLVLIQMVQTTGIEAGRAANNPVDLVPFGEQKLCTWMGFRFKAIAQRGSQLTDTIRLVQ